MNINDAEFFKKLRSTFKIEGHDHLRTISMCLLDLEKISSDDERKVIIETIHREFHSLKGASRAVSIKEIETICHTLETIFSKVKKGNLILTCEMFDIFNIAIDVVEDILFLPENEIMDISSIMNELIEVENFNFGADNKTKINTLDTKENSFMKYSVDTNPVSDGIFKKNKEIEIQDVINSKLEVIALTEGDPNIYSKDVEENISNVKVMENTKPSKDIEEIMPLITTESKYENKDLLVDEQGKVKQKYKSVSNNINKASDDKNSDIVRVSKGKLDSLLLQGEEMIYAKLSAMQRAKEIVELREMLHLWKKEKNGDYLLMLENNIDTLLKSAENDAKTIETMTDTFMEDIKDIMLLPFASIIEGFPKMVRDLSRQISKEIEFKSKGTDIEIDRRILEEIKDPLMHIIRNSVDHGIEDKYKREGLGKKIKGSIQLNISQVSSDKVKIEISDDGEGINLHKLKEKVVKNKLYTTTQVNTLDDESIKMLIFKSGLSTSDIITDLSGRGLGLAIVYEKVQKLEGSISVSSKDNKGTTFTIILPITISTNRGIIVKAEKQVFVVPTGKVEKAFRIKKDEIKIIENMSTILLDGEIIPLVNLKDILELQDKKVDYNLSDVISILVVKDMEKKIGLTVDEVVTEQEVLVKRFNKQLKRVRNISGATILGSGEVVPILDVQDLIKSSYKHSNKYLNIVEKGIKDKSQSKSILVVEDSITSRTLLKNILETQGYLVKTAVHGLQGWGYVKNENFDLVITDVEMPEMDGFELTEKIRNDSDIGEIPVILVTSLDSREHKEKGIDVGASAYIVKSDFQQSNLLETIKRLI